MIDDDTSYCTNNRLRAAMGSGEGRPVRGHPAPGVIWLHAPQTVPCRWGAAQATLRAWRPPRPCGRTRGPRGMLSLGAPGATLQGRTAGAGPRASEVGSPWPQRLTPTHEGTRGRCTGHDLHSSRPRSSGAERPRSYPNTCQIGGWTPCWRKPTCWHLRRTTWATTAAPGCCSPWAGGAGRAASQRPMHHEELRLCRAVPAPLAATTSRHRCRNPLSLLAMLQQVAARRTLCNGVGKDTIAQPGVCARPWEVTRCVLSQGTPPQE